MLGCLSTVMDPPPVRVHDPVFAGDGALLVREEMHDHVGPAEPETTPRDADDAFDNLEQYIAVIVVGEFVTTLVSTEEGW